MDDVEHQLILRAKQRDVDAFEQLVAAYEGWVYRLALQFTNDPADAMDVVQDVFLTVYTKLPTLRGEGAFATWVTRIAVNTAYMKLMYNQPIKTFVFIIAALFVVAPLILAAEPSSGINPAWQRVGAIQGQDKIVSHGPKPADPGMDTDVRPSDLRGGVGATQR